MKSAATQACSSCQRFSRALRSKNGSFKCDGARKAGDEGRLEGCFFRGKFGFWGVDRHKTAAVEKACAKRKDAGDRDATQRLQRR
jgi:hypothetical protein